MLLYLSLLPTYFKHFCVFLRNKWVIAKDENILILQVENMAEGKLCRKVVLIPVIILPPDCDLVLGSVIGRKHILDLVKF